MPNYDEDIDTIEDSFRAQAEQASAREQDEVTMTNPDAPLSAETLERLAKAAEAAVKYDGRFEAWALDAQQAFYLAANPATVARAVAELVSLRKLVGELERWQNDLGKDGRQAMLERRAATLNGKQDRDTLQTWYASDMKVLMTLLADLAAALGKGEG